jgi:hypothetical protein
MNPKQYEELCRFFLAQQLGISVETISSISIPNPSRPDLPSYKHQIDLYWETEDAISLHLHIANAKWRRSDKVDQPDVLLLQQVKQKVAAHRAVMLTNSEFTKGAVAAAMDDGIALHIVRPEFNFGDLHANDATTIQAQILQISASRPQPIYSNEVVHRAFDLARVETATMQQHPYASTGGRPGLPHSSPMVTGFQNRSLSHGGGQGLNRGGNIGGSTRQGGGPGFQTR